MTRFDNLDRQIVVLLQRDGRTTNSEIARRVGVTEGTVRRRVEQLVRNKVIRIAAVANPFKIGLSTVALISIDVDLPRMQEVAMALVAMKEVRYVGYATGAHDIIIEAIFPDNAALLQFVSDRLSRIPGIVRTETSIQLDVLKRSYEWEIPPVGGDGRYPRRAQAQGPTGRQSSRRPAGPGRHPRQAVARGACEVRGGAGYG